MVVEFRPVSPNHILFRSRVPVPYFLGPGPSKQVGHAFKCIRCVFVHRFCRLDLIKLLYNRWDTNISGFWTFRGVLLPAFLGEHIFEKTTPSPKYVQHNVILLYFLHFHKKFVKPSGAWQLNLFSGAISTTQKTFNTCSMGGVFVSICVGGYFKTRKTRWSACQTLPYI